MNKNGKKWLKNRVFGYLKKMMSLVLPGITVKRKFASFWKKSDSWPMRFQYS